MNKQTNSPTGSVISYNLFFELFEDYIKQKDKANSLSHSDKHNFCSISLNVSNVSIEPRIAKRKQELACNLYFYEQRAIDFFPFLQKNKKKEIESNVPGSVIWFENSETRKGAVLKVYKFVKTDVLDKDYCEKELFPWLYEMIVLYKQIIPKYYQEFQSQK